MDEVCERAKQPWRGGPRLPALLRCRRRGGAIFARRSGDRHGTCATPQRKRSTGIAGGEGKVEAIRGAARGGLVNVLITDLATARALIGE